MAEFEPITTQEEFDARIGERLKRERETVAKQYEGYVTKEDHDKAVAAEQKKYNDYLADHQEDGQKIKDLQDKVKEYETASVKARIAHETGLPYGMSARLSGETEEEIKKDAETLKKMINFRQAPPAGAEPPLSEEEIKKAAKDNAYKKLLSGIKEKE